MVSNHIDPLWSTPFVGELVLIVPQQIGLYGDIIVTIVDPIEDPPFQFPLLMISKEFSYVPVNVVTGFRIFEAI